MKPLSLTLAKKIIRLMLRLILPKVTIYIVINLNLLPEQSSISEVDLPIGEDHEDEFFGVQKVFTETLTFDIDVESTQENPTVTIRYQGCAEKGLCYSPTKKIVYLNSFAAQADDVLNNLSSNTGSIYSID